MAVHRSAASFNRALERRAARAEARATHLFRRSVVIAAETAIRATPFKTGHLASNWRLIEAGGEPEVSGKGEASEEAVLAALEAIKREVGRVRLGDSVEVANAVGYAVERAAMSVPLAQLAVSMWLNTQRVVT